MSRRALKPGEVPTSELVVETAAREFGTHGFDGLSLRDLGRSLGVTAPTLLHHIGSKRKLYARVLAHVTASVEEAIADGLAETESAADDDATQVAALLDAYLWWSREHEAYARLLMRELLDNRDRAATGNFWPLAATVKRVAAQVHRIRGGSAVDATMTVFQTIGAIAYFATAEPTLRKMLGFGSTRDLDGPFRAAMHEALRVALGKKRRYDRPGSDSRARVRGAGELARQGRARGATRRVATTPA